MTLKKYILPVIISLLIIGSGVGYAVTKLFPSQGGTGQDSSWWNGTVSVNSGVWTASTSDATFTDLTVNYGIGSTTSTITYVTSTDIYIAQLGINSEYFVGLTGGLLTNVSNVLTLATTSIDYWETQQSTRGFATTSVDYWGSQRDHTAITWSASGFAVSGNGIGNTQLEYNTGQHLTTTANVEFAELTVTAATSTGHINIASGMSYKINGTALACSNITNCVANAWDEISDITGNGITDTQLAFDTGQHLTDTSYPTFSGLNLTYGIDVATSTITTMIGDITGSAGTVTNATLSTALTVNTGTLTLTASNANTSVLTIGAGAVSVSGSNTGDQDLSDYWDADGDITVDEISESKINFSTVCGTGYHYYLNGNDLACEADDTGTDTLDDLSDDDLDALQNVDAITEVTGDILYVGSSGNWTRLASSTDGYVLTLDSNGYPSWASATAGGDITSVGTCSTGACDNFTLNELTITHGLIAATSTIGIINITEGGYYKYNDVNFAMASTTLYNYFTGGSGNLTMTGNLNTGHGLEALSANTTGISNVAIGHWSQKSNTTGDYNTTIGGGSSYTNTTGNNNTVIGNGAFLNNNSGSGNIALGYYAGRYELGSNAFYVNNQDRTNTAGDKAKSLLYGTFAATAASQTLAINAHLTANYGFTAATSTFTETISGSILGNAGTATALASNPTDCGANTWATTIAANGNLTCSAITYAGITAMTSANFNGIISDNTGSGKVVFDTSPTFITPALGTPASGSLTNCSFPTLNQNTTGSSGSCTGLAATASALAGNGNNCSAGSYALGVNASGAAEGCTDATTEINSVVNALGGTGLTCSSQSCNVDLGTSITTGEITDDTITHADIADSDQTDTKCIWFEDPTATDDFKSIWANKTANNFLITEIWGESDQTVSFDLQIDDGTPADVSGTDIAPAAGEAEDTSLAGDTTLAAGEELDLIITSVTNTPTWVSICWTGNWVD